VTAGVGSSSLTPDRRIPSLDGLRAVSIALVLLGHLAGTNGFPIPMRVLAYADIAGLGVHVFFVISGFLISGLLLDEMARTRTISLSKFYLRRTLRIFPPYYTLLFCVAMASTFGWLALAPGDMAHALSYTMNYRSPAERAWWLGHTWSLAVEEQFYLLWPAALLILGRTRGLKAALLIALLAPLIRLAEWYGGARELIGNSFETVADALATGCLLAGYRAELWSNSRYQRLLKSPLFIVVPTLAVALAGLERPRINFAIGITLSNLCIAATIDWCIRNPDGRVGRVLNARPVAFVGVLSYSIYLWQQLFLNRASTAVVARFPLNLLLALACACLSYYAVERPSLRLRRRLEPRSPHSQSRNAP
jgi:peptidoglycan/LPS O-acetylase OafA/YrhL